MKYCRYCGRELMDEAIMCPGCMRMVEEKTENPVFSSGTLQTVSKIFMVMSTVSYYLVFLIGIFGFLLSFNEEFTATMPEDMYYWGAVLMFSILVLGILCIGFLVIAIVSNVMTVKYFRTCKKGEQVSVAFAVCTLIFVNVIAGICMLVQQSKR